MSRAAIGWTAIALGVGIGGLAASPWWPSGVVEAIPGRDKTGHVVLMGGLAAACVVAFAGRSIRGWRLTSGRVLSLVALGVTVDEGIQALVPARTFDLGDLAASLAGVVVIGGLAAWSRRSREAAETNDAPRRSASGREGREPGNVSPRS